MEISLIVAMARNRVIGRDQDMPWYLPADLKFFKRKTLGKPLIMGRTTFESIGRPLPGREVIVLSTRPGYRAEGCLVCASLEDALAAARASLARGSGREAMIGGGGHLYRQALGRACRVYLTEVDAEVEGDTFFPELPADEWAECRREAHPPEADRYGYAHVLLERRAGARAA